MSVILSVSCFFHVFSCLVYVLSSMLVKKKKTDFSNFSDLGHAEILAFDSELQATQQELARRKAGRRNKIQQTK